ncbi:biotin holocarboxylase synthetase [Orbilia blumenaviensis]|uniref:Biotin holocarboxylase synthetase n=1 Tax=Orbilia blumenaviensis TaxID=1796055 RepID=A0AAV9V9P0_9PEZI
MNVLVYSGPGTSAEAIRQSTDTLRRLLTPYYAVSPITAEALIKEPWPATCALLCVPGGADLGYCKSLNGAGTRALKQYVRRGGKYLGFCAGAYFASAEIEFEKGDPSLEVTGARELGFFPGLCRGAAFKGFEYNSEAGARPCILDIAGKLSDIGAPGDLQCYYNGGGVFIDADGLASRGVEVLARYREALDICDGSGNAAAVGCHVGAGYALLIGAHPEFSSEVCARREANSGSPRDWGFDETRRLEFMSALLKHLGLRSNDNTRPTSRSLSDLHLSGLGPTEIKDIWQKLKHLGSSGTGDATSVTVEAETATFLLENQSLGPSTSRLGDGMAGGSAINVKVYEDGTPADEDTPYFNVLTYFQHLRSHRAGSTKALKYGSPLLYGELMTSTNSILDKNFKLLQELPSGFTVVAIQQTAARGRGSNSWISPLGALVFSMVVRHSIKHAVNAPAVFIQYLAALSIVEAIKSYDVGYSKMPVYLKWPNDIYAKTSGTGELGGKADYSKICGILVNANFSGDEFFLVIGCGVNVTNSVPTTSLKALARAMDPPLPEFQHEKLLAKIIVTFEKRYARFLDEGFQAFEEDYYEHWLHNNQIVGLDDAKNSRVRIQGISKDDGMLIVSEVDEHSLHTGTKFKLQADGNSFDFFNGLLKKKRD